MAFGFVASAAIPYVVSLGKITKPPFFKTSTAFVIAFVFCLIMFIRLLYSSSSPQVNCGPGLIFRSKSLFKDCFPVSFNGIVENYSCPPRLVFCLDDFPCGKCWIVLVYIWRRSDLICNLGLGDSCRSSVFCSIYFKSQHHFFVIYPRLDQNVVRGIIFEF